MIQRKFAENAAEILKNDNSIIGMAVAGSWITNEIDQFSDLDLIIVTSEKISHQKDIMLGYANRLGKLLSAFTGEHVGEPRLLICLYDNPLLHVDLKFVTLQEFHSRIETPVILLDNEGKLQKVISGSESKFPFPDYQWIEDRFWIWIHYALLKIGRGEYFEALDFLGFLRMAVFGPLLHIKNKNLPRGVRKVETGLSNQDLEDLKSTLSDYSKEALLQSLENAVSVYRKLRQALFSSEIIFRQETEKKVMRFFDEIKSLDK